MVRLKRDTRERKMRKEGRDGEREQTLSEMKNHFANELAIVQDVTLRGNGRSNVSHLTLFSFEST